jgi:hypothetical protein
MNHAMNGIGGRQGEKSAPKRERMMIGPPLRSSPRTRRRKQVGCCPRGRRARCAPARSRPATHPHVDKLGCAAARKGGGGKARCRWSWRARGSGQLVPGVCRKGGGGAERLPEFPSPLFLRSANAQATVYAGRYHKPAHNAGRPDSARQGDARFGAHRLPRRCHPGTQPDDAPLPRAFPSLLRPGLSGPRSLRRCESSSWMTPPGPSCATSRARCARTISWC